MSSHIDFRTLPANIPSLCIPRVYSNIDERRIRKTFDDLNLGIIERVDIIRKTTEKGDKCNRVFIHFSRWFSSKNADTARERLLNGQDIKIIYDDPWFWKVAAYREAAEPRSPDRRVQEPRRDETRHDSSRDRRPEPRREDRRLQTKERVDKDLDRINLALGNVGAVKPQEVPANLSNTTNNCIKPEDKVVAVKYDEECIKNIKKRVITIRKVEPIKPVEKNPEDDKGDW